MCDSSMGHETERGIGGVSSEMWESYHIFCEEGAKLEDEAFDLPADLLNSPQS